MSDPPTCQIEVATVAGINFHGGTEQIGERPRKVTQSFAEIEGRRQCREVGGAQRLDPAGMRPGHLEPEEAECFVSTFGRRVSESQGRIRTNRSTTLLDAKGPRPCCETAISAAEIPDKSRHENLLSNAK
jgi:hypothetical protein